jgi:hypothetical protein
LEIILPLNHYHWKYVAVSLSLVQNGMPNNDAAATVEDNCADAIGRRWGLSLAKERRLRQCFKEPAQIEREKKRDSVTSLSVETSAVMTLAGATQTFLALNGLKCTDWCGTLPEIAVSKVIVHVVPVVHGNHTACLVDFLANLP